MIMHLYFLCISSKTKPDLEICDVPREVAGFSLRYIKTIFMFYSLQIILSHNVLSHIEISAIV